MRTYRLSSTGRRIALLLLGGALAIWGFGFWMLQLSLGISYHPLRLWGELQQSWQTGPGADRLVPAMLMLVLIVSTPLLIWNILEEWAAAYTPGNDGLHFEALGIRMIYPWKGIIAVQHVHTDGDDPFHELVLDQDYTGQIRHPLLRLLHAQAFGRLRLPIYAGIAARDELLAEIRRYTGLDETVAASVDAARS